ncbi:MAG: nucleoside deaminase [Rickettsiales bacterium]|jgi:guanine deaminase|nr:nucleoside deaminase [Rickettsiales bacterium]
MTKITDQDICFMEMAIKLAGESIKKKTPFGGPFGAVVVKNGKVIGRGFNRVIIDHDPTAHGEIVAIRDACKNIESFDLSGCVLYASCKPCPMCLAAAGWANIELIYYAANSSDAARIGFRDSVMYKDLPHQKAGTKIKSQAPHAAEIMHEWHEKFYNSIY